MFKVGFIFIFTICAVGAQEEVAPPLAQYLGTPMDGPGEIGEPCIYYNKPGTCKSILECELVRKIVSKDEEKPVMCKWEGVTRIVCCPHEDLSHTTGVFKEYFRASEHGVKRSKDLTCRYEGRQPMICCQTIPDRPQPPEPQSCPRLNRPTLGNGAQHVAWQKCLDYQRYVDVCVSSNENPDVYTRKSACGIDNDNFRISGGTPARPKEFPHMAVLGCHNSVKTSEIDIVWVAGGSLISDRFILTAGHVLVSWDHGVLRYALLGTLNKKDARSGTLYNVIRRIPYPTYTPNNKRDDLALLELDRRVILNEFIRPACLPAPGLVADGPWIVAGWGNVNESASTSDILLKTELEEEEPNMCRERLMSGNFVWNGRRMLCAVGRTRNSGRFADTCQGDSGGPLMQIISRDLAFCSYVIKGVVAFGPTCGEGSPAVYTNVANEDFMRWIVQNVWPEDSKNI